MNAPRAAYELEATEQELRRLVMGEGGPLAATMRRAESAAIDAASLVELWRWVAYLRIVRGHRAQTTVARYAEVLTRFLVFVAARGWSYATLDVEQIEAWLKWLALGRHNRDSWRGQQLRSVRNFYEWRAIRGLGANCAAAVRGPKPAQRKSRKYTAPQLRAMFGAIVGDEVKAIRDRAILLFLLATGARREECATLELEQIEMSERRAHVRFFGKGAKERDVAFEGPAVAALRAWLVERDKLPKHATARLWLSLSRGRVGTPIGVKAIESVVARVAKRAGLAEHGVHRFRVTFATKLYDSGVDIERVRILLGHSTIETTRHYLDVSERNRGIRLSGDWQHELLGTRPAGMPRYVEKLQRQHGGGPNDAF